MNKFISCTVQLDGSVDIYIPPAMVEEFKLTVFKGLNCTPNQSDDMRDFHDRLRNAQEIMGNNMKSNVSPRIFNKEQASIIQTPVKYMENIIEKTKEEIDKDFIAHPNYHI